MSGSILNDTKKALGIGPDDTSFDVDVLMHLNSALSTLTQLGVGPATGFEVEDASATWDAIIPDARYNMIKSYLYLRVRQVFDPATTSFTITSFKEQREELESRISYLREDDLQIALALPIVVV